MHLAPAQKLAARIAAELAPFCARIEVAGSLRRRRDWVNDIDLVVLPRPGQLEGLLERCACRCRRVTAGRVNHIFALPLGPGLEIQLDLFVAHDQVPDLLAPRPTNWGTLLLCRTGSKEHNIYMAQRALDRGLRWNPYEGLFRGSQWLAGDTEEGMFRALDLEPIAPEKRER